MTENNQAVKKVNAFENFEGVSYTSLHKINEREANKAMIWAQKQLKKKRVEGKD